MRALSVMGFIVVVSMASCVPNQQKQSVEPTMDREKKVADESVPSLTPPKTPDDQWSQWLVGEWESLGESDLGQFKNWVKGRGRMTAEVGLGGQFLILRMEGRATEISDEYLQYIRQTQHTSEEDIKRLQDLPFEHLELQTIDPKTGQIIAYMFDSWRCVAKGTGKREGNRQVAVGMVSGRARDLRAHHGQDRRGQVGDRGEVCAPRR